MDRPKVDRSEKLNPHHGSKRNLLTVVGVALLAVGIPCAISVLIGFWSGSVILFILGAFLTAIGIRLLFFGHSAKIARDAAGELGPVLSDVGGELANKVRHGWDGRAHVVPEGRTEHSCGAWNDLDDGFCKGCGGAAHAPCVHEVRRQE